MAAQNAVTFAHLDTLPLRDRLKQRLTELWDYPRTGLPVVENGRLFYAKNTGLQRQAPIYMRTGVFDPPSLVLDPNALSPDGSMSLAQYAPSPDAKLLAYAIAEGGADWETVRVRSIADRRGSRRHGVVGPLLRSVVDARFEGLLLLALSGAAEEQGARSGAVAARRSTTTASARRKPTTC